MLQEAQSQEKKLVPAYVLVGFLGSGKTTVLSQLIEWCVNNDLKPGLIINEFGDISIDGEAVRQAGMQMTELTSGCVCCTAGEDMTLALIEMATRPDIDLIFLEATGLADPADMLDELTEPFLWQSVEVGGIISIVDSKRFVELSEDIVLARRQVQYADILVMNKCDLISSEWRAALAAYLPTLAPHAKIFQAEEGQLEEGVEALLAHSLSVGRKRHQMGKGSDEGPTHEEHAHSHEGHSHEHEHEEHAHSHEGHSHEHEHEEHTHEGHTHEHGHAHESIHTVGFPLDVPLNRIVFEQFIESLPKTVYRAKGFITFTGDERTFVFQYIPGYTRIKAFPLHDHSLLRGVFIGRNLDKEWLANKLVACQGAGIKEDQRPLPAS